MEKSGVAITAKWLGKLSVTYNPAAKEIPRNVTAYLDSWRISEFSRYSKPSQTNGYLGFGDQTRLEVWIDAFVPVLVPEIYQLAEGSNLPAFGNQSMSVNQETITSYTTEKIDSNTYVVRIQTTSAAAEWSESDAPLFNSHVITIGVSNGLVSTITSESAVSADKTTLDSMPLALGDEISYDYTVSQIKANWASALNRDFYSRMDKTTRSAALKLNAAIMNSEAAMFKLGFTSQTASKSQPGFSAYNAKTMQYARVIYAKGDKSSMSWASFWGPDDFQELWDLVFARAAYKNKALVFDAKKLIFTAKNTSNNPFTAVLDKQGRLAKFVYKPVDPLDGIVGPQSTVTYQYSSKTALAKKWLSIDFDITNMMTDALWMMPAENELGESPTFLITDTDFHTVWPSQDYGTTETHTFTGTENKTKAIEALKLALVPFTIEGDK
jgi:hypothetical protein